MSACKAKRTALLVGRHGVHNGELSWFGCCTPLLKCQHEGLLQVLMISLSSLSVPCHLSSWLNVSRSILYSIAIFAAAELFLIQRSHTDAIAFQDERPYEHTHFTFLLCAQFLFIHSDHQRWHTQKHRYYYWVYFCHVWPIFKRAFVVFQWRELCAVKAILLYRVSLCNVPFGIVHPSYKFFKFHVFSRWNQATLPS